MPILLGIDTGGTYTDAVLHDEASGQVLAAAKTLTTRHDLAVGIRGAAASVLEVSGIAPASVALVSLSTTLATNALVEGQGGRVGLVLIGFDEAAASRAGIVNALREPLHPDRRRSRRRRPCMRDRRRARSAASSAWERNETHGARGRIDGQG